MIERGAWWSWSVWRATRSVFFMAWPYRLVGFVRRWAYDVLALLPIVGVAVWWSLSSDATELPSTTDVTRDDGAAFLLAHHVARFFPTAMALLLCVLLMRVDRLARADGRTGYRGMVAARVPVAAMLVLTALFAVVVLFVPGPLAARLAPCAVALLWAWLVRRVVYGRFRLLVGTAAGFRPRVRSLAGRRARREVRRCLTAEQEDPQTAAALLETVAETFAQRGDTTSAAWCVARAIDAQLACGALHETAELVSAHATGPLGGEPAFLAARGLFLAALGDREAEAALLDAERACRRQGLRVPYRLRMQRTAEAFASSDLSSLPRRRRGAEGRRVRQVWNRQYATVLRELQLRAAELEATQPAPAEALALGTGFAAAALAEVASRADMSLAQAHEVLLVEAAAYEQAGGMAERRARWRESSELHCLATELYTRARHRPGAALCGAFAALAAIRSGRLELEREAAAMVVLAFSLRVLELDRGRMTEREHRARLLATREQLHSATFRVLARHVRFHSREAAELSAWLMESTHRNALVDAMRRDAPSTSQEEPFRAPVDLHEVRQRLGNRVALSYRCERVDAGWRITTVLMTTHRCSMRETVVSHEPGDGAGDDLAPTSAAAILDLLHARDADEAKRPHTETLLRFAAWERLAERLLPPALSEALEETAGPDSASVLLIVPDGPLSGIPFPGLRLPGGSQLVDRAAVVLMPNLLLLPADGAAPAPSERAEARIVTNLGPTRFTEAFGERVRSGPHGPRVSTIETCSRRELDLGLAGLPRPDLVVIANHGHTALDPGDRSILLADGATLSVRETRRMPWPPVVVLVACWAADITVTGGDDPLGLPTACLLGRASTVIGGQSQISDAREPALLLTDVVLRAAAGRHPALALREATVAQLERSPAARGAQPAQWANLSVWSSEPPDGPPGGRPAWQASWLSRATSRSADRDAFVDLAVLERIVHLDDPPVRKPIGRRYGPHPSRALLDIIAAAVGADEAAVLTTAGFVAALDDARDGAWQALVADGFGIASARAAAADEREHGGEQLDLDTHLVTATAAFAGAFRAAASLAEQQDQPEVLPAHMLYGILADRPVAAARLLTRTRAGGREPLDVLAADVFQRPLPERESLAPALPPRTRLDAALDRLLPLLAVGLAGRWLLGKTGRFALGLAILLLLAVVVGLHSAGGARPSAGELARLAPALTASVVDPAGAPRQPATLLGKLSSFYVAPTIDGVANGLRQALRSDVPSQLDDRYAFVTPAPRPPRASAVRLVYRGHSFAARRRCPRGIARWYCVVVATLPEDVAPAAFEWSRQDLYGSAPGGGTLSFTADVYPMGGRRGTVDSADLRAAWSGEAGRHPLQLSVLDRRVRPLRAAGPVVLHGVGHKLSLLGVATPDALRLWAPVYPATLLYFYVEWIAGSLAPPVSGETATAGFLVAPAEGMAPDQPGPAYVGSLCTGGPAEDAGLRRGDRIVAIGGGLVDVPVTVVERVRAARPGGRMPIVVMRGATRLERSLRLGYVAQNNACG